MSFNEHQIKGYSPLNVSSIIDQKSTLKEQLYELEYPLKKAIKAALAGYGQDRVGIENYFIDGKGNLVVTYGWSCRGSCGSADMTIPIEVIQAENPYIAAEKEKTAKEIRLKQNIALANSLKEKQEYERLKAKYEI